MLEYLHGLVLQKHPVNKNQVKWKGYVLDRVDVGLVTSEGLDTATGPEIPDFCSWVTSSRDKESLVGGKGQAVLYFRCIIQEDDARDQLQLLKGKKK